MKSRKLSKNYSHKKMPLRFKGKGGAFVKRGENYQKTSPYILLNDSFEKYKYLIYNIALALALVLIFVGIIIGDNYTSQQKKLNEKDLIAHSWSNISNSVQSLQPFFKNIMDYSDATPDGFVWFNRIDLSCRTRFGANYWIADESNNSFNCYPLRVNLFNLNVQALLDEMGEWVRRAELTRANFDGAYLSYADFYGARLIAAKFRGIIATEAKFEKAILSGADFRGAMLNRAQFRFSILEKVDFRNANLSSANFTNSAKISSAKFDGAWAYADSLPEGLSGFEIKICENNSDVDKAYNDYLTGQILKFDIDKHTTCKLKKLVD